MFFLQLYAERREKNAEYFSKQEERMEQYFKAKTILAQESARIAYLKRIKLEQEMERDGLRVSYDGFSIPFPSATPPPRPNPFSDDESEKYGDHYSLVYIIYF